MRSPALFAAMTSTALTASGCFFNDDSSCLDLETTTEAEGTIVSDSDDVDIEPDVFMYDLADVTLSWSDQRGWSAILLDGIDDEHPVEGFYSLDDLDALFCHCDEGSVSYPSWVEGEDGNLIPGDDYTCEGGGYATCEPLAGTAAILYPHEVCAPINGSRDNSGYVPCAMDFSLLVDGATSHAAMTVLAHWDVEAVAMDCGGGGLWF